jgi:hypothetical protein
MKQIISWLRNLGLRQIITVVLATLTFLVVPAFNYNASLQAQAETLRNPGEYNPVTPDTVKRIQEKAEDLGDAPGRRIGDTGLENIKQLPESIPKAIELRARQAVSVYNPNEPNSKEALDRDQEKVGKNSPQ